MKHESALASDRNRVRVLIASALGLAGVRAIAAPQPSAGWPSRPLTFVVPFAPGTATDAIARALAEAVAGLIKGTIVVENRAGASAAIGASAVARATPDGHTLLLGSSTTHAANAALFSRLTYDPIKDFAPISVLGEIPQVMVVHPHVPARSIAEFVAYAKAQKASGGLSYAQGSSGNHVAGAILNKRLDLGMTMVAYRSPPPALVDVMGGVVPMMFADMSASLANIRAGRLRALAVSSQSRSPVLPDVPAMSETMPGFELTSWIAMWAPAQTPDAVVATLNRAVRAALSDQKLVAKLQATGFSIFTSTPNELGVRVARETLKWAKLVMESGIERQ
jgi:tripartite-type tricarboxylate transporter receptor subunit TctC